MLTVITYKNLSLISTVSESMFQYNDFVETIESFVLFMHKPFDFFGGVI